MTSNKNEEQKTPEEIGLEIEKLRSERAQAEAQREQKAEERRQDEARIREANADEAWRAAAGRTGVRFHDDESTKASLKAAGFSVTPSNTGETLRVLDRNGKQVTLESALETLAVLKPWLVHSGADHLQPRNEQGQYSELCRDDFGNNFAAKSRFIMENPGVYETLPQHRVAKVKTDEMTAAQYMRLPLSEKSNLVSELGEAGIQQILRRK